MLVIDIGNSLVKSGLFEEDTLVRTFSMPTKTSSSQGLYMERLHKENPDFSGNIIISSVSKDTEKVITRDIEKYTGSKPFMVNLDTDMGIKNLYTTKESLGIDRLINAAAAYHLYTRAKQLPAIVVDMGTATTIDYITKDGEFIGGVIAPGMLSSYRGLLAMAQALPEVELRPPDNIIGTSTATCLRSGVVFGHKAMVETMVKLVAQASNSEEPIVILTGGISLITSHIMDQSFVHDPWLLLKGLKEIGKINGLK